MSSDFDPIIIGDEDKQKEKTTDGDIVSIKEKFKKLKKEKEKELKLELKKITDNKSWTSIFNKNIRKYYIQIIAIVIGVILFIFGFIWALIIPIAAFAAYTDPMNVINDLNQVSTPMEYEKFFDKYSHSFIQPPMYRSGVKGSRCDVWRYYRTNVLNVGMRIYGDITAKQLWHVSPSIQQMERKCQFKEIDVDIFKIKMKDIKIVGKKRRGIAKIFGIK